jgi:hypothetical protein
LSALLRLRIELSIAIAVALLALPVLCWPLFRWSMQSVRARLRRLREYDSLHATARQLQASLVQSEAKVVDSLQVLQDSRLACSQQRQSLAQSRAQVEGLSSELERVGLANAVLTDVVQRWLPHLPSFRVLGVVAPETGEEPDLVIERQRATALRTGDRLAVAASYDLALRGYFEVSGTLAAGYRARLIGQPHPVWWNRVHELADSHLDQKMAVRAILLRALEDLDD